MVNQKNKGKRWEKDAVNILNDLIKGANFKRIPGSGMIGSILKDSRLTGDLSGTIPNITNEIKLECKSGYGEGQMTIKKEWLDKIQQEAYANLSIPILFCKFDNARAGVKYFIVMDVVDFARLINSYTDKLGG
jgi:hypothetical protein